MALSGTLDRFLAPRARTWRDDAILQRYGIRNLMRAAKVYNGWRYRDRIRRHRRAYERDRDMWLEASAARPPATMRDGWALDTSGSLPHLDRLLDEAGRVARERAGRIHGGIQRSYLRDLVMPGDLAAYPSWLDFVTSPAVLATVIEYLRTIPVLSKTYPPGVRFMESNQRLDPNPPGAFADSQLYHLDLHDTPLVYVIVLIEDVTMDCGPWTFLPASVSARAARALGYQKRGRPYRIADEVMYEVVRPDEAVVLARPKGTVLFIDSSRCFHYGSRLAYTPRLQMMYAYTSACRADFSETFMDPVAFPLGRADSPLRRMVLE